MAKESGREKYESDTGEIRVKKAIFINFRLKVNYEFKMLGCIVRVQASEEDFGVGGTSRKWRDKRRCKQLCVGGRENEGDLTD